MDRVIIYLSLMEIKGIGRGLLNKISLEMLSSVENDESLYKLYLWLKTISKRIETIAFEDLHDRRLITEKMLFRSQSLGIVCLDKYSDKYPKGFKKLEQPPVVVFVKGNIECLNKKGVAIIGSRDISETSFFYGTRIGEIVAENNLTVISGLALGSDTAGHKGCLNRKGKTVAILGHGLDIIYPGKNRNLANEILENGGCLLSEYPIGVKVSPYNLIDRDRLQAALACGTIVIEASLKSGTMNAVLETERERKPLACLSLNDEIVSKYMGQLFNTKYIDENRVVKLDCYDSVVCFLRQCLMSNEEIEISLF